MLIIIIIIINNNILYILFFSCIYPIHVTWLIRSENLEIQSDFLLLWNTRSSADDLICWFTHSQSGLEHHECVWMTGSERQACCLRAALEEDWRRAELRNPPSSVPADQYTKPVWLIASMTGKQEPNHRSDGSLRLQCVIKDQHGPLDYR